MPDYQKNDPEIFRKAATGLQRACQRAEQLKTELKANDAATPDTDMHLLVTQFRRMQRS